MLTTISRCNMEPVNRYNIWVAAMALLATCGVCTAAGVGKRQQTGSIMDIINTEKVEQIIAARRRNEEHLSYARNELGDSSDLRPMVVSIPDSDESTEPPLPSGIDYKKILKSSKNALQITKKEYLKDDWCNTEPLVQKIREAGCIPATIVNNFCYGQCNSFYIPKGPRRRGSDDRPQPAFKSCPFCKPKKYTWVTVTLRCPGQNPPFRRKRIQKIKQCKCLSVGVN